MSNLNAEVVAELDGEPITRGELNAAAWGGDVDAIEYMATLAEAGDEPAMHSLRLLSASAQAAESGYGFNEIFATTPEPADPPAPKRDYGPDLDAAIDDFMSERH